MEPIFASTTTNENLPVHSFPKWERNADKVGVIASIACAIHCILTPFFLLALPTFGKIWAHPASHWGMALFVVPIAALMMSKGYARHRQKWILFFGGAGILFVLAGAVAPYFDSNTALNYKCALRSFRKRLLKDDDTLFQLISIHDEDCSTSFLIAY